MLQCSLLTSKLLLSLLLLAAMTYSQVQSFQINDYVNHYVDIEITGYRVLYSESIAGRGVAGTAGPIDCFNRVVEYSQLLVGPGPSPLAMPLKRGT